MNMTLAESLWTGLAVGRLHKIVVVLTATLVLAISAKIQVPFWPVPMTMQTFVVLMIGAAFGARLAAVTLLTYLAEGALGLPVFATGTGLAYMAGPTAGYLAGFLVAATLVGWFADRGHGRSVVTTLVAFLAGEAVILMFGTGWLSLLIGFEKALDAGLLPFLPGEGVKVALACALLPVLWRLARR
ncbi:biotin transporter BioY [Dongia sp.]|uniref:biotin transporter BioY n=1 Tax=Dongia sp. TaxID=1977262 RepID=UPI0035B06028